MARPDRDRSARRARRDRHALGQRRGGRLSILWALFMPDNLRVWAGFVYFLMGPAHWTYGGINGRRRRAFLKTLA